MKVEEQVKKDLLALTQKQIVRDKMMIEFYQHRAENASDEKTKGEILLKAKQLGDSLNFNQDFYDFFSK